MKVIDAYRAIRPPSYTDSWHLNRMAQAAQLSYEKRFWLVVEKAVRHGGSEMLSIYGPAARLAVNPHEKFMVICSGQSLANKFSNAARNALLSPKYPVPYKLTMNQQAQWSIDTGQQGDNDATYFASGVDGARQGRGCSVGICDDIYKSGFVARQQGMREKYHDTIQNSVINRLTPDGVVHFLGARIHPADELGLALEGEREGQLEPLGHLRLPATNDSGTDAWFRFGDDIEHFPAYESLWPDRYPRKKLDAIRLSVSEAWWQSQYQQSPSLAGQTYFNIENVPRYDYPNIVQTWTSWDLAQTATLKGSFSAGCAIGADANAHLYLLEARRGRWTQEEMQEQIVQQYHHIHRMTGVRPHAVICERAAAGFSALERLAGILPMEPANPHGTDKESRAGGVASIVNRGLCS
ncbi:MAG: hypothetical protein WB562_01300, partial [Candidatus Sulfotelmatobacter sp.]